MDGGVYLIQGDDQLVEMTEQPFENEDLLQALLAKFPRVLGGDQFDREAPRRWLLVTREAPIPSDEEGPDRWAVDHLFVDESGIPTFVEVKRSSDTRIRREVVGQMLDYVAHALLTWRADRLRAYFEAQCGERPAHEVLAEVMGPELDPGAFWESVKTNLQAGKVRLVFVADEVPPELRRVVEFLNKQMSPAEVLAIEVKQYTAPGGVMRTLVPTVIGQTAEADAGKGKQERGPRWDEARFFASLACSREEANIARELLRFGPQVSGSPVEWGTGKERGSFTAALRLRRERFSLFSVYTTGHFSFNIGWSNYRFEPKGMTISEDFRTKVNAELGLNFDRDTWEHSWTMTSLAVLVPDGAAIFKRVISDLVGELKRIAR